MTENDLNNDLPQNDNNNDNINLIQDIQGPSPYIKEISNLHGERIIKIIAWKSIYFALILFAILEIIEIIIALTLFRKIFIKWLFIFLLVPFMIMFLLIPINAICKFDYNNKTFSSYITPIIPIPYCFYRIKVQFEDISFFYFFKIKKLTKRYYKIGINLVNGEDKDIIVGQDHTKDSKYDPKLLIIPKILKSYLRP